MKRDTGDIAVSIILVILLTGAAFFILKYLFAAFVKCYRYTVKRRIRFFGILTLVIYALGAFLLLIVVTKDDMISYIPLTPPLILALSIAILALPTIVAILRHGIGYGIGLSFFRSVTAFLGGLLIAESAGVIAGALLLGAFCIEGWFDGAYVMVTLNGEILALRNVGDSPDLFSDMDGRTFYKLNDRSFICNDTGEVFFIYSDIE